MILCTSAQAWTCCFQFHWDNFSHCGRICLRHSVSCLAQLQHICKHGDPSRNLSSTGNSTQCSSICNETRFSTNVLLLRGFYLSPLWILFENNEAGNVECSNKKLCKSYKMVILCDPLQCQKHNLSSLELSFEFPSSSCFHLQSSSEISVTDWLAG